MARTIRGCPTAQFKPLGTNLLEPILVFLSMRNIQMLQKAKSKQITIWM